MPDTIRWDLTGHKIDIAGPDGNTFFLLGKLDAAIRHYYGIDAAKEFTKLAWGRGMEQLGIVWRYEDILEQAIELTGIEFTSPRELTLDEKLYTIVTEVNTYL